MIEPQILLLSTGRTILLGVSILWVLLSLAVVEKHFFSSQEAQI